MYDYFIYTGKVYNDTLNDSEGKGIYLSQGLEYTYIGGYKHNKKNGFGRETFSEKDIEQQKAKGTDDPFIYIEGDFKDDVINKGILKRRSGATVEYVNRNK